MTDKLSLIRESILATKGTIFAATVVKRDGTIREFNARTYVDTGGDRDTTHNMLTVIEVKNAREGTGIYRTIALEGVKSIRANGTTISFEDL
jgi:hypothetical protein